MSANTDTAAVNSIDSVEQVDRDIPCLTTKKKKNNITRLAIAGAMLLALLLVATGCALFMKRLETQKQEKAAEKAKERPKESAPVAKDFEAAKKRIKQEEDAKLPPPASAVAANAGTGTAAADAAASGTAAEAGMQQPGAAGTNSSSGGSGKSTGATGQAGGAPVQTAEQRRLGGDVLVAIGNSSETGLPGAAFGLPTGGREIAAPPKNGFDERLKPSQLVGGVAAQRPDLSMLLRRGTTIPCGQYTYIKTTHPGAATCVVSKDVYSANGDTLLVERGSMAFGEGREGLSQGQDSVPVLWTRIDTTRGVTVDINSLGTDALGSSGVPVAVDNHLMQRFGGAVMLSLITDAGQALANKANNGQGTIRLSTTSTAGQDLATKTLENTINIPPTGYSPHGSVLNILVLRDMDFRSVYELARY